MLEFLDDIPSWAHNWCYLFAIIGALELLKIPLALLVINRIGMGLFFIVVIDVLFFAATLFTLFWMCRSSLRNSV